MKAGTCSVPDCGRETSLLICGSCWAHAEKRAGKELSVKEALELLTRKTGKREKSWSPPA